MTELPNYKRREDWHAYWAFQDPDFIYVMNKLYKMKHSQKNKIIRDVISKEYAISTERIIGWGLHLHMFESIPKDISSPISDISFDFVEGEKYCSITLKPSSTKEEYLKTWESFVVWRDHVIKQPQINRKKPPENTQLIYAIFRARSNGLTFKEIYGLYSDDKLPLYRGKLGVHKGDQKLHRLPFGDSESLARYYRKYRPDT